MNIRQTECTIALVATTLTLAVSTSARQPGPAIAYPTGYRSWQHVRTIVVGPDNANFARRGGIHHYYANGEAVEGYRTGTFPNGSVIVDEGVLTKDGDGRAKGILFEADRRSLDVMVKNDRVFKDTAGWGYEHFDGMAQTPTLGPEQRQKCAECHSPLGDHDSVFAGIRP